MWNTHCHRSISGCQTEFQYVHAFPKMAQRLGRVFLACAVSSVNRLNHLVNFACSGWYTQTARRVNHVLITVQITPDKKLHTRSLLFGVVRTDCKTGESRVGTVWITPVQNYIPVLCCSGCAQTAKRVNHVLIKYESPQTKITYPFSPVRGAHRLQSKRVNHVLKKN